MTLHELLHRSAARTPEHTAVETLAGESLSYAQLDARAQRVAEALAGLGVSPGDRVGVQVPKSIAAVVAQFGVLASGAAYVPVDASGPRARAVEIFSDCGVRAVLADSVRAEALLEDFGAQQLTLHSELDDELTLLVRSETQSAGPADLAYILSTSGSTGRPKGVTITHANALSFVRWVADTFPVGPEDRFSSHAPFHFDLSIFDLYVPMLCGGTLVLIDEATGKQPRALAPLIAEKRLTVWYSTPSILSLLVEHGRLERHTEHAPRLVFFAGEVFPVAALRALTELWPDARYLNLYGPTETNVCTWFEVPTPIPAARSDPFPIGKACDHVQTAVLDDRGASLPDGSEGELCARGAPVTSGYWQRPELNEQAFHEADDGNWYRTGDIVREEQQGYVFLGRRDRMVKRRGNRVELGEVEARLHRHPEAREVAVLALPHADGLRLQAFIAWRAEPAPTLLALKRFCAEHLPAAMVPDTFTALPALPRTSTDKIDYESLKGLA
ncbi:MAG: D-alanine--poly(phosphoribitol) ligase [Planctomycetota bacterium]|nr:MAG: D-alanine--poly(phosphoribitol) ligase [Planctomycetota bacterium]